MNITCELPDVLEIGTKVFLPRPALNSVQEDEIVGYYCIVVKDGDKTILHPTDYKLQTANLDRYGLTPAWKRNEFFLSYEDAKAAAVEYPVSATDEEWVQAIGLSKDMERSDYDDACELGTCCANISDIRDILFTACKDGCLTAIQKSELIHCLKGHEPAKDAVVLSKILAQFGINWEELEDPTPITK